jgi:hypothetical protein
MNRIETAARADTLRPLESLVPALPLTCAAATVAALNRATDVLEVFARAETVKFRGYDVGYWRDSEPVPAGTATLGELSVGALLCLRADVSSVPTP